MGRVRKEGWDGRIKENQDDVGQRMWFVLQNECAHMLFVDDNNNV